MGDIIGRFGRTRIAIGAGGLAAFLGAIVVAVAARGGSTSPPAQPIPTISLTSTSTPTIQPTATPEPSPTPIAHAGILDGMPMSDDEWAARKDQAPIAVMLDNTASANPHAGLIDADLVYEAFVEGGITRLMAVYWRQDAQRILPVRSARTPFVNWVVELGAMYGHAGGATTENEANAIGQIYEYGIRDLNAFSPVSSNYYYRDSSRYGPYDLATNTAYLKEAASELGFSGGSTVESWKFRDPLVQLPTGEPAGGIEIDYSGQLYAWQYIQWHWDAASERYLRFQFGGPEVDADSGAQLAFSTVVVMRVPSSVVDDVGHVVLEQIGSGPVTVFTGGQAFTGTWKKASREARTRFYNAAGDEIVFERGPIFVEAIGLQSGFEFTSQAADLRPLPEYVAPPPGSAAPEPADESPSPTELPTAVGTPRPTATSPATASASPGVTTPAPSSSSSPGTPTGSPAPSTSTAVPSPTSSPVTFPTSAN
ncbi:MAG: DUF3048 domain-containing protein [bacterium]